MCIKEHSGLFILSVGVTLKVCEDYKKSTTSAAIKMCISASLRGKTSSVSVSLTLRYSVDLVAF